MKGDYGSLVWVNDDEGHEFVCTLDNANEEKKDYSDLTEEEKSTCMDVSNIVGTERW